MSPKTIFFTGAPLPRDLPPLSSLPSSSSGSASFFLRSIAAFAGLKNATRADDQPVSDTLPPSTSSPAPWHSLPLEGEHLATGFSQVRSWQEEYQGNAAYYVAEDPIFLSTRSETSLYGSARDRASQRSAQELLEDVTSQFYEHSLALHDDLPTSQIAPASASQSGEDSGCTTSFNTTSLQATQDESLPSSTEKRPAPNAGQLTNLDRLPTEAYLKSISPQTMSINIIVGIISISPPRTVHTRHGSTVEIVEMLVGDDHRSGFGINFWLPSTTSEPPSALREALQDLRPQDIIMVRNMALSSFKGKVYGQSLRKETTKVDLLYRNRVDRTDRAGCYKVKDFEGEESEMQPLVAKTKRVREWVLRFVGGGPALVRSGNAAGKKGKGKRTADVAGIGIGEMPPDTQ